MENGRCGSEEFARHVEDLARCGGLALERRRLFGTDAWLRGGRLVALASGGRLYVKAPAEACAEASDAEVFRYRRGSGMAKLNMRAAPAGCLEDPSELRSALDAALALLLEPVAGRVRSKGGRGA